MEDKLYKILWIDDEHEGQRGFVGQAKLNEIELVPFKSLNAGIGELKKNYRVYDAVLLDAKFYENEDDVQGSEDTNNVHRAKEELLRLPKKFDVFILTGQAEAYDDKTFNQAFKSVYDKGKQAEWKALFKELKVSADKQSDTQLRHRYSRVFDVCTERYIGENAARDLLDLLNYDGLETGNFNLMRKIVEDLFCAFYKYDLLPSEFVKPNIALNQSSKFLCGKEQSEKTHEVYKKNKLNEESVVPEQINNYFRNILHVTQAGSHRSIVDEHVNSLRTPYLFKSVLFQLLDVLVWFKQYIDSKPLPGNWESLTDQDSVNEIEKWIEGEVINYNSSKGFAFLSPTNGSENQFIPPHLVTNSSLKNGDTIKGLIEEYEDNRTGQLKTRIKKIS